MALAMALVMAGLTPATALAQNRRLSKSHVEALIKRVEVQSDALRRQVDRTLDRSALDGTNREDRINDQMKDLENELDSLRREFDRTDSWWETRRDVDDAMREARDMQRLIATNRALRPIRGSWNALRRNLNELARAYGVPRI
jgi:hypothetical protein